MAKKAYVGVSNTARNIKAIYVGVNGVARKVTKAYVGVGNVARLFYEAVNLGTWPKYIYFNANGGSGSVPPTITFSSDTDTHDTTSARPTRTNYTFYGWALSSSATASSKRVDYNGQQDSTTTGSWNWTTWCSNVGQSDATVSSITLYAVWVYSGSTTKTISKYSTPSLSGRKFWSTGNSIGSYAVFGPDASYTSLEYFNTSLSKSTMSSGWSSNVRSYGTGNIGKYMAFIGGYGPVNTAHFYNSSLTKTDKVLSENKIYPNIGTIGNYMVVAGGAKSGYSLGSYTDTFNSSLTKGSATAITKRDMAISGMIGTSYFVIAGGRNAIRDSISYTNVVEYYNTSLTRSSATRLSTALAGGGGGSIGDYFVMAGGYNDSTCSNSIVCYNSSLTKSNNTMGYKRACMEGGYKLEKLGDYLILAGGQNTTSASTSSSINSSVETLNTSLTLSVITSLSVQRRFYASATIGDYTIIGGGFYRDSNNIAQYPTTADIYKLS